MINKRLINLPAGYTHSSALIGRYLDKIAKTSARLAVFISKDKELEGTLPSTYNKGKIADLRDEIDEYHRQINLIKLNKHPTVLALEGKLG